jgi:hypothetical protein
MWENTVLSDKPQMTIWRMRIAWWIPEVTNTHWEYLLLIAFPANEAKSVQITFNLKKVTCPPVQLNNNHLPQTDSVKYLCIHLDRKLTWRNHISAKRIQLDLKLRNMYWIIGRKSQLPLANKLLVYRAILKPIWTYGIQLWGNCIQL